MAREPTGAPIIFGSGPHSGCGYPLTMILTDGVRIVALRRRPIMHEVMQNRTETMAQQYLDQLTRFLHALPERDRSDAVREIASHIAESHAAGQPVAVVLAAPGRPARPGHSQHRRENRIRA